MSRRPYPLDWPKEVKKHIDWLRKRAGMCYKLAAWFAWGEYCRGARWKSI